MKMQLVLAAATALVSVLPAQAQTPIAVTGGTNITIGGLLAVGVKQSTIGQGNAATARPGLASETRLDDNTSRLTVSSSSKIADGWAVIFRVESRFSADVRPGTALGTGAYAWNAVTTPATGAQTNTRTLGTASGWADGDTWGGISSPYGTITAGKSTLYYTDTIDMSYLGMPGAGEGYRIWDANGLASFNMLDSAPTIYAVKGKVAVVANAFTLGNSRSQNVLKYDSPTIKLGGDWKVSVAWSKNPNGNEPYYAAAQAAGKANYENGGLLNGKINYVNGGFVGSLSLLKVQPTGSTIQGANSGPNTIEAYRIGAGYALPLGPGRAKIGVVYDHTAISNYVALDGVNANATSARGVVEIPVSYSWGAHGVYLTWTKAGDANSNVSNTGATQWNLAYDYALTKRAFVGLAYTHISNQSGADYNPFLSNSSFGPSTPAMGESWGQIGVNLNYWF